MDKQRRKELQQRYKEMKTQCVCQITNRSRQDLIYCNNGATVATEIRCEFPVAEGLE